MGKKKTDKITELIVSHSPEMVNTRFLVQSSIMNNGYHDKSIMFIITDLVESGFSIKFFNSTESAANLLKLLKAASN